MSLPRLPRERETLKSCAPFNVSRREYCERRQKVLGTILVVILILMLVGSLPAWPHSKNWGYYPSGGLGLVVVILLILLLTGRI